MRQHMLDRAIARSTGESVADIRSHGFVLLLPSRYRIRRRQRRYEQAASRSHKSVSR
jgi:hypothetical protein